MKRSDLIVYVVCEQKRDNSAVAQYHCSPRRHSTRSLQLFFLCSLSNKAVLSSTRHYTSVLWRVPRG